jgi:diacylglycerol kinase (ATP)
LADLVFPSYHEKAGLIKDIAAEAVLIAAVISVIISLLVFVPKILRLWES